MDQKDQNPSSIDMVNGDNPSFVPSRHKRAPTVHTIMENEPLDIKTPKGQFSTVCGLKGQCYCTLKF